jgi:hypothetical protein
MHNVSSFLEQILLNRKRSSSSDLRDIDLVARHFGEHYPQFRTSFPVLNDQETVADYGRKKRRWVYGCRRAMAQYS